MYFAKVINKISTRKGQMRWKLCRPNYRLWDQPHSSALANKLVTCAWLSSGALEVWRLGLRLGPTIRLTIRPIYILL